MNKFAMVFAAVVALISTASVAQAEDGGDDKSYLKAFITEEAIAPINDVETKTQETFAKDMIKKAKDMNLVNAEKMGKLAAWAIVKAARKCMVDKGHAPDKDKLENGDWSPPEDEHRSCVAENKGEGEKFLSTVQVCQENCLPREKVEEARKAEAAAPAPETKPKEEPKPTKAEAPKPAKAETPASAQVFVKGSPIIMVYNTNKRADGAAKRFAKVLNDNGFPNTETGNFATDVPWELSSVEFNCAFEASADKVRALVKEQGYPLGKRRPCFNTEGRQTQKHHITVILGNAGGKAAPPPDVGSKQPPKAEQPTQAETPPAKQPKPKEQETLTQPTEPEEEGEDAFAWVRRNHETTNNALGVPSLSWNATVRMLGSAPITRPWVGNLMPSITTGPNLRLMFDNQYLPFAFSTGPLFNLAYQTYAGTPSLNQPAPFGFGGHAGVEGFYTPFMHKPATPSVQRWYIADKLHVGGYLDGEYMATMFRADAASTPGMNPFEQHHLLCNFGVAVRLDLPKRIGGMIWRMGPTIGLKYERQAGWAEMNQAVYGVAGLGSGIELFGRVMDLDWWLQTVGQ